MFKRQKQLILRSTTLAITLVGVIFFTWFDSSVSTLYSKNWDPNLHNAANSTYNGFYWLIFWTHLSNLGAFAWISLSWVALVFKIEKLEKIMNGQYLKNLVFTFIIVTGLVFMSIAYIPTILCYSNTGKEWAIDLPKYIDMNPRTYGILEIVCTTFKHLLIPLSFIILALFDGEYTSAPLKQKPLSKALTLFIVPVLYVVYVGVLASYLNVQVPYVIFNFSGHPDALWLPFLSEEIQFNYSLTYIINIILVLMIAVVFIGVSYLLTLSANKQIDKSETTEEIVGDFDIG